MESQIITCQNCQTPNPAKNLYCQSCGKPLVQAAPPPMVPPSIYQPEPGTQVSSVEAEQFSSQQSASTPVYPTPTQGQPPMQDQEPGWQGAPQPGGPPPGYRPQEMPPQQPAYYPVSPPPPQPAPVVPTIENLGAWKDGWTDLIAGEAAKAEDIEQDFVESIKTRNIPMVMVEKMEFASKFNKKNYLVVRNTGGAVAVKISPNGNDLSLSWALYTKHVPNWRMLAFLAAVAFVVSFLNSLGTFNFGIFFVNWVFGAFGWLMPIAVLALIGGYVWKGSLWYFFLEDPGDIADDELTALSLAVHQSIHSAVEKAGLNADSLRQKPNFRVGINQRKM
jgi:hypothetical protein